MSLQFIVDSAQRIEFNRSAAVTQSVSRSGRILTQSRNFTKPWSFKITPAEVYRWDYYRPLLEAVLTADRHTEQTINFVNTPWFTAYRGTATLASGNIIPNVEVTAYSGNRITIDVSATATGVKPVARGDIIQFAGTTASGLNYRYPYAVSDVLNSDGDTSEAVESGETEKYLVLNRAVQFQSGYEPTNSIRDQNLLKTGAGVEWTVLVTSLPDIALLPGQLMQFTDDIEVLESII